MIQKVTLPTNPGRIKSTQTRLTVEGMRDTGFILVHAPELDATTRQAYDASYQFFSRSDEFKMAYHRPDSAGERGYSPLGEETGAVCQEQPGRDARPDAKEFFALGRALGSLSRQERVEDRWRPFYLPNVYPDTPGFEQAMTAQHEALGAVAARVLRAIALEYGHDASYFDEMLVDGASMTRALHYPALTSGDIEQSPVWGCAHRDLSFVTVLTRGLFLHERTADPDSGLFIKPRKVRLNDKQDWVRGVAPPGYAFVQMGDLGQTWSGDELFSAWHEIRAPRRPTRAGRITSAHFAHVRPDVVIGGVAAGDYVLERLEHIGLAKAVV